MVVMTCSLYFITLSVENSAECEELCDPSTAGIRGQRSKILITGVFCVKIRVGVATPYASTTMRYQQVLNGILRTHACCTIM